MAHLVNDWINIQSKVSELIPVVWTATTWPKGELKTTKKFGWMMPYAEEYQGCMDREVQFLGPIEHQDFFDKLQHLNLIVQIG